MHKLFSSYFDTEHVIFLYHFRVHNDDAYHGELVECLEGQFRSSPSDCQYGSNNRSIDNSAVEQSVTDLSKDNSRDTRTDTAIDHQEHNVYSRSNTESESQETIKHHDESSAFQYVEPSESISLENIIIDYDEAHCDLAKDTFVCDDNVTVTFSKSETDSKEVFLESQQPIIRTTNVGNSDVSENNNPHEPYRLSSPQTDLKMATCIHEPKSSILEQNPLEPDSYQTKLSLGIVLANVEGVCSTDKKKVSISQPITYTGIDIPTGLNYLVQATDMTDDPHDNKDMFVDVAGVCSTSTDTSDRVDNSHISQPTDDIHLTNATELSCEETNSDTTCGEPVYFKHTSETNDEHCKSIETHNEITDGYSDTEYYCFTKQEQLDILDIYSTSVDDTPITELISYTATDATPLDNSTSDKQHKTDQICTKVNDGYQGMMQSSISGFRCAYKKPLSETTADTHCNNSNILQTKSDDLAFSEVISHVTADEMTDITIVGISYTEEIVQRFQIESKSAKSDDEIFTTETGTETTVNGRYVPKQTGETSSAECHYTETDETVDVHSNSAIISYTATDATLLDNSTSDKHHNTDQICTKVTDGYQGMMQSSISGFRCAYNKPLSETTVDTHSSASNIVQIKSDELAFSEVIFHVTADEMTDIPTNENCDSTQSDHTSGDKHYDNKISPDLKNDSHHTTHKIHDIEIDEQCYTDKIAGGKSDRHSNTQKICDTVAVGISHTEEIVQHLQIESKSAKSDDENLTTETVTETTVNGRYVPKQTGETSSAECHYTETYETVDVHSNSATISDKTSNGPSHPDTTLDGSSDNYIISVTTTDYHDCNETTSAKTAEGNSYTETIFDISSFRNCNNETLFVKAGVENYNPDTVVDEKEAGHLSIATVCLNENASETTADGSNNTATLSTTGVVYSYSDVISNEIADERHYTKNISDTTEDGHSNTKMIFDMSADEHLHTEAILDATSYPHSSIKTCLAIMVYGHSPTGTVSDKTCIEHQTYTKNISETKTDGHFATENLSDTTAYGQSDADNKDIFVDAAGVCSTSTDTSDRVDNSHISHTTDDIHLTNATELSREETNSDTTCGEPVYFKHVSETNDEHCKSIETHNEITDGYSDTEYHCFTKQEQLDILDIYSTSVDDTPITELISYTATDATPLDNSTSDKQHKTDQIGTKVNDGYQGMMQSSISGFRCAYKKPLSETTVDTHCNNSNILQTKSDDLAFSEVISHVTADEMTDITIVGISYTEEIVQRFQIESKSAKSDDEILTTETGTETTDIGRYVPKQTGETSSAECHYTETDETVDMHSNSASTSYTATDATPLDNSTSDKHHNTDQICTKVNDGYQDMIQSSISGFRCAYKKPLSETTVDTHCSASNIVQIKSDELAFSEVIFHVTADEMTDIATNENCNSTQSDHTSGDKHYDNKMSPDFENDSHHTTHKIHDIEIDEQCYTDKITGGKSDRHSNTQKISDTVAVGISHTEEIAQHLQIESKSAKSDDENLTTETVTETTVNGRYVPKQTGETSSAECHYTETYETVDVHSNSATISDKTSNGPSHPNTTLDGSSDNCIISVTTTDSHDCNETISAKTAEGNSYTETIFDISSFRNCNTETLFVEAGVENYNPDTVVDEKVAGHLSIATICLNENASETTADGSNYTATLSTTGVVYSYSDVISNEIADERHYTKNISDTTEDGHSNTKMIFDMRADEHLHTEAILDATSYPHSSIETCLAITVYGHSPTGTVSDKTCVEHQTYTENISETKADGHFATENLSDTTAYGQSDAERNCDTQYDGHSYTEVISDEIADEPFNTETVCAHHCTEQICDTTSVGHCNAEMISDTKDVHLTTEMVSNEEDAGLHYTEQIYDTKYVGHFNTEKISDTKDDEHLNTKMVSNKTDVVLHYTEHVCDTTSVGHCNDEMIFDTKEDEHLDTEMVSNIIDDGCHYTEQICKTKYVRHSNTEKISDTTDDKHFNTHFVSGKNAGGHHYAEQICNTLAVGHSNTKTISESTANGRCFTETYSDKTPDGHCYIENISGTKFDRHHYSESFCDTIADGQSITKTISDKTADEHSYIETISDETVHGTYCIENISGATAVEHLYIETISTTTNIHSFAERNPDTTVHRNREISCDTTDAEHAYTETIFDSSALVHPDGTYSPDTLTHERVDKKLYFDEQYALHTSDDLSTTVFDMAVAENFKIDHIVTDGQKEQEQVSIKIDEHFTTTVTIDVSTDEYCEINSIPKEHISNTLNDVSTAEDCEIKSIPKEHICNPLNVSTAEDCEIKSIPKEHISNILNDVSTNEDCEIKSIPKEHISNTLNDVSTNEDCEIKSIPKEHTSNTLNDVSTAEDCEFKSIPKEHISNTFSEDSVIKTVPNIDIDEHVTAQTTNLLDLKHHTVNVSGEASYDQIETRNIRDTADKQNESNKNEHKTINKIFNTKELTKTKNIELCNAAIPSAIAESGKVSVSNNLNQELPRTERKVESSTDENLNEEISKTTDDLDHNQYIGYTTIDEHMFRKGFTDSETGVQLHTSDLLISHCTVVMNNYPDACAEYESVIGEIPERGVTNQINSGENSTFTVRNHTNYEISSDATKLTPCLSQAHSHVDQSSDSYLGFNECLTGEPFSVKNMSDKYRDNPMTLQTKTQTSNTDNTRISECSQTNQIYPSNNESYYTPTITYKCLALTDIPDSKYGEQLNTADFIHGIVDNDGETRQVSRATVMGVIKSNKASNTITKDVSTAITMFEPKHSTITNIDQEILEKFPANRMIQTEFETEITEHEMGNVPETIHEESLVDTNLCDLSWNNSKTELTPCDIIIESYSNADTQIHHKQCYSIAMAPAEHGILPDLSYISCGIANRIKDSDLVHKSNTNRTHQSSFTLCGSASNRTKTNSSYNDNQQILCAAMNKKKSVEEQISSLAKHGSERDYAPSSTVISDTVHLKSKHYYNYANTPQTNYRDTSAATGVLKHNRPSANTRYYHLNKDLPLHHGRPCNANSIALIDTQRYNKYQKKATYETTNFTVNEHSIFNRLYNELDELELEGYNQHNIYTSIQTETENMFCMKNNHRSLEHTVIRPQTKDTYNGHKVSYQDIKRDCINTGRKKIPLNNLHMFESGNHEGASKHLDNTRQSSCIPGHANIAQASGMLEVTAIRDRLSDLNKTIEQQQRHHDRLCLKMCNSIDNRETYCSKIGTHIPPKTDHAVTNRRPVVEYIGHDSNNCNRQSVHILLVEAFDTEQAFYLNIYDAIQNGILNEEMSSFYDCRFKSHISIANALAKGYLKIRFDYNDLGRCFEHLASYGLVSSNLNTVSVICLSLIHEKSTCMAKHGRSINNLKSILDR